MPPRPQIDRLPAQVRDWLCDALKARGFAEYDDVTAELNARLDAEGFDLNIGRTAVYKFGRGQQRFMELQRQSDTWAQGFLAEEGVDAEARRHKTLFSMLSQHAFRTMANAMADEDEKEELDFDPRDLHFLGRMLKDLMASSGLREVITDKALDRELKKERDAAAGRVETASRAAGLTPEVAAAIRAAVQGGADQ